MNKPSNWQTPGWRGDLTSLAAGILLPLSMAPYNFWALGILSTAVFAGLLKGLSAKRGFFRSLWYGLGMYGGGTSWVFVSIHDFGNAPVPLALAMTAIFVGFLALVFAAPFYFYCRYFSRTTLGFILGFASIWVLGEWLRSWFLTGFPWLYVGYAHINSWLSGWTPVLGVFGISWLAVLSGNIITQLIYIFENRIFGRYQSSTSFKQPLVLSTSLIAIWVLALSLTTINWVKTDKTISTAIVQPNIPLEMKWQPMYRPYILNVLRELSEETWDADLVVWPEAAVPLLYNEAQEFLYEISEKATETNTALITGILYDDLENDKYYNAIMGLGHADNIYFKQRLVPFGEYVPLEEYLRGLIEFFDLPNSIIHPGPKNQKGLSTASFNIAPYICYEIVYPDLVAKNLENSAMMITISNDAWFGDSIGPLQHYQMAQMRALENGRYIIRATNTGLSGVISHKGETVKNGTQFVQESLSADIELTSGNTPFTFFRSYPVLLACVASLLLAWLYGRRKDEM